MSLRIEFARLRRIAARSVCPPFGENNGVIGLREGEACQSAACLGSALEHSPRRADISLIEQRAGARHQFGHFRTALRHYSRGLLRSGCLYSLRRLGGLAICSALKRSAWINRARLRFTRYCHF